MKTVESKLTATMPDAIKPVLTPLEEKLYQFNFTQYVAHMLICDNAERRSNERNAYQRGIAYLNKVKAEYWPRFFIQTQVYGVTAEESESLFHLLFEQIHKSRRLYAAPGNIVSILAVSNKLLLYDARQKYIRSKHLHVPSSATLEIEQLVNGDAHLEEFCRTFKITTRLYELEELYEQELLLTVLCAWKENRWLYRDDVSATDILNEYQYLILISLQLNYMNEKLQHATKIWERVFNIRKKKKNSA